MQTNFFIKIFRGPPFRPQKISRPPFSLEITGQLHRKTCELNFHWKVCDFFPQDPPPHCKGQKI